MTDQTTKRGRPPTGSAKTAKERQQASRATRKQQRFETFPPMHLSILLSAEASQALNMLTHDNGTSKKALIESLLIEAYRKHKLL